MTTLAPATLAGRFALERQVGSGGMGVVYRAEDNLTGHVVAVKLLESRHASDLERFHREARLLLELSHPAIVAYVSHGIAEGRRFLAMEWLEGEDLADRLSRAGLTVEETLALGKRVAAGLSAAHARGIVHRDVKPSNLMLVGGDAERTKLLDFGVARGTGDHARLTRAGAVLGTAGYMAPEQATGASDVDARADVFALGCVLYECSTGRPAFPGDNVLAILAKVMLETAPRPSVLRPDIPPALDDLVTRMMAKQRGERPRDGAEVLRLLEALEPTRAPAPRVASLAPRALTSSEQRFLSLVMLDFDLDPGSARTVTPDQAVEDDAKIEAIAARFEATVTALGGSARVLSLAAHAGATLQAAHAASAALELKASFPTARVALATGRAELEGGRIPVGPVIDRATALLGTSAAADLHPRMDDVTASLLGPRFEVRTEGAIEWLVGLRASDDDVRPLMGKRTPCLGREKELGLLEATLAEVVSEPVARAVVVTAPPGTGKSRMRQEFMARVKARGDTKLLFARAEPVGAGWALALVRQLVRQGLELREGEPAATQFFKLKSRVESLIPGDDGNRVAEFLGELVGAPTEAPSPQLRAARNDPRILSERMRRAFLEWLRAECAASPVVLFLEDLHWGDLPSVTYLAEALRELAARPLLVVATARPEVHELFPKLWAAEGAQVVRLAGLTRSASEKLVRLVLGDSVAPATVTRIVERADGNAFYLEELIRRVAEHGVHDLPETVLAMVEARLQAIEPEARRVLRAASIFGEQFWERGVATLLGEEASPGNTAGWLRILVDRELLMVGRGDKFPGETEYAFRHGLLREAAYSSLTGDDRVAGHLLAAGWLEAAGEQDAVALAEHYERGGDPERARPWLSRAALAARDGGNLESAVAFIERALATNPVGEDLGLLRALEAECHAWRLDWRGCLASSRAAVGLLPRHSAHWFLAVSATIYASATLGTVGEMLDLVDLDADLEEGVPAIGPFAQALAVMIIGLLQVGQAERSLEVFHALERVAARTEGADPAFLGWWQVGRVTPHLYILDELGEALASSTRALELFEAAGDRVGTTTALLLHSQALVEIGEMEDAMELCTRAEKMAQELGLSYLLDWAHTYHARSLTRLGRLDEAAALAAPVAAHGDAYRSRLARLMLAEVTLRRGGLEEAETEARTLLTLVPEVPHLSSGCHGLLAGAAYLRGDLAAARTHAEDGLALHAKSSVPYATSALHALRVQALRGLSDDAATAAAEEAARARVLAIAEGLPERYRATFLALPLHAAVLGK